LKKYAEFIGVGSYVPEQVLTNQYFVDNCPPLLKCEKGWTDTDGIKKRTGMETRHFAFANQASSDLMVEAAKNALLDAGLTINDMDLIICSTSFQDNGFNVPRTSEIFATKIGAKISTLVLEENAACAGFTWALERARIEMLVHEYEHVLVVSGDKVTAAVNYNDRSSCILFGDGAGAVILKRSCEPGIIRTIRENDTTYLNSIVIPAGGSAKPMTHSLLDNNEQFMAMPGGGDMLKIMGGEILPNVYERMLETIPNIKYIVPHQANLRIIEVAEAKIKRNLAEKGEDFKSIIFKDNIACYGNTSGSSVPLALDTLYRQGNLEEGDYILLVGFGAGFLYGANLLKWTKKKFYPQGGK
jgi:3-oxoacyl-[acyl-carrier-protein] synthase-3